MNRESLIKGLATLVAVALVVFLGFSIYRAYVEIPKMEKGAGSEEAGTLDANMALTATLDTLENTWISRQSFKFLVNQDPLHLGRVIKDFQYADNGKTETEEDNSIRLTATVIDSNPKAIIKYNGKSYVVQTGDYLGKNYKVMTIEKMQVVLDNNGKRLVLINKPVTTLEDIQKESEYSNNTSVYDYNY